MTISTGTINMFYKLAPMKNNYPKHRQKDVFPLTDIDYVSAVKTTYTSITNIC